jgi:hypothetical protein
MVAPLPSHDSVKRLQKLISRAQARAYQGLSVQPGDLITFAVQGLSEYSNDIYRM